jgi:UrcA family protein
MNTKSHARSLLIAVALGLAPQPAAAQTTDAAVDASDEITVIAPRTVTDRFQPSVPDAVAKATISLRLIVLYTDLDLKTETGTARLMTRIDSAARDACKYLDRLYPLDPDKACIDAAVASARPQADAAIAAVKK